jgi:hypothetical protein
VSDQNPLDARTWCLGHDVAVSAERDDVTVLDFDSPQAVPLTLSGTALTIWSAVNGHSTTEQIVAATAESYDLPADGVRDEVARFLDMLRENGILALGA